MEKPVIALIVPCYDEEAILPLTNSVLLSKLEDLEKRGKIGEGSLIVYVDDRSNDSTWNIIRKLSSRQVRGLRLSRHSGHQCALIAGMEYVVDKCDACITIDADLQDDPDSLSEMVEAFLEGGEIVYGVRKGRATDGWIKRITAAAFYKTMRGLGADCIGNHADYRLLTRRAVEDLLEYEERNLFLRGIVPQLGYEQRQIYYDRLERKAGKSKYPFRRMAEFAIDGITSFTVRPVRMLFWLGVLFMLTALGIGIYVLVRHFSGATIEGWTSLILSIWFCTGILLMGLGVVGEYIGKIYIEVKHRPRFRIDEKV
ncbi:MAG: glycosyltransferase family 2 protein [Muribaculaceae bacterium]|nr:glycosyltransferase family 2 protein [Muribaculaceae bacterium]MDE6753017.1 glycosyltransferase family 2 protein [Muribaculaceae bacterium]